MNILKRFKTCSLKMVIVTLIMSFKYLLVTVCDIEECTPYTDWSEIVRTGIWHPSDFMGCAKWYHHHLAKRERLWDWDRSNALCTLYILLVILVYLSDVFISLDCFFTECSISLWIKEVWIILFTFFSFIVFQTINFATFTKCVPCWYLISQFWAGRISRGFIFEI